MNFQTFTLYPSLLILHLVLRIISDASYAENYYGYLNIWYIKKIFDDFSIYNNEIFFSGMSKALDVDSANIAKNSVCAGFHLLQCTAQTSFISFHNKWCYLYIYYDHFCHYQRVLLQSAVYFSSYVSISNISCLFVSIFN